MGLPIQTTRTHTGQRSSGAALARPDAVSGPCRSFGSHKQISEQIPNPWEPGTLRRNSETRQTLAKAARANGHKGQSDRLRNCGTGQWGFEGGQRLVGPDGSPARTVYSCEDRLCPACARKRAARVIRLLEPVIAKKWEGERTKLLTFTMPDVPGVDLKTAGTEIREAFKKLRRRVDWKARVRGGVVATEVTRNRKAGTWHVHLHVLAAMDYWPQAELLALWRVCLNKGAKAGGVRIEESRKGLREVVKYIAKGIEAANWEPEDLQELMEWMRGQRLLATFGNLYGVKMPPEEGEGTEEVEEKLSELHKQGFAGINPKTGELVPERRAKWIAGPLANEAGHRACFEWWLQKRESPPGEAVEKWKT